MTRYGCAVADGGGPGDTFDPSRPDIRAVPEWRPDPAPRPRADYGILPLACAGVARKP